MFPSPLGLKIKIFLWSRNSQSNEKADRVLWLKEILKNKNLLPSVMTEHKSLHIFNFSLQPASQHNTLYGCQSHPCNSFRLYVMARNIHIHWQTSCVINQSLYSWHHHSQSAFKSLLWVGDLIRVPTRCKVHEVQSNVYTVLSLECVGLCQGGISIGTCVTPTFTTHSFRVLHKNQFAEIKDFFEFLCLYLIQ